METLNPVMTKQRDLSKRVLSAKSELVRTPAHPLLHLQRSMGNRAVQRLLRNGVLQAKLAVSAPDDEYEQEADRVAARVLMRMCACGDSGMDEGCSCAASGAVQRRAAEGGDVTEAPPIVEEVLRAPGQPLDRVTRTFLEPRFGLDFSQVRVHTDGKAAESAQAINALAYTVGSDIVFGADQYSPATASGQRLLAHELTHVVQQSSTLRPAIQRDAPRNKPRREPPKLEAGGVGTLQSATGVLQRNGKHPRIKLGKVVVSHDPKKAEEKGRELADIIRSGRWTSKHDDQLRNWLEFFEGSAWYAFAIQVSEALGGSFQEFGEELRNHPEGIDAAVGNTVLVVPTSHQKVVRGGFKVAYAAQIIEETSDSTTVEVYHDFSGGAEFSIEPKIKEIVKFKFSAGYKGGRKSAEKSETKEARRTGQTISRSFTIQKLERQVFTMLFEKTYYGVSAKARPSLGLDEGSGLASRVTREYLGSGPEMQEGFQIVPEEGGENWGPFWNVYDGRRQVKDSALEGVWGVLKSEQEKTAKALVFGWRFQ